MQSLRLSSLLIIVDFLHLTDAFDWSQAKNQSYLQWYLKFYREHKERKSTDSFHLTLGKLHHLLHGKSNLSKTIPIEKSYIQYYPGECDVIIAVPNGGKLKPKSLPTRYPNVCRINGYNYQFQKKMCKLYSGGQMFRYNNPQLFFCTAYERVLQLFINFVLEIVRNILPVVKMDGP